MAESLSVHDKVNEINDSESETQSDGSHGSSDEDDNDRTVDTDEKKPSAQQPGSRVRKRRTSNKKRAREESEGDEADDGMKRDERRAANRLSAFQSRQRRKSIISDLQKTVAQLSKDGDDQRRKNREKADELEKLRNENELLRSQILGGGGEGIHAADGSQKMDVSSIVPGLNFSTGGRGGSTNIQDPLLLANGLSSIDAINANNARAHLSSGQIPDHLRQQYLSLTQLAGSATSPVNSQDQMMGLLNLLSQIGSVPTTNPNVAQFGGQYASIVRSQAFQPQAQVDAAQMQHLLELLRRSNDGNLR